MVPTAWAITSCYNCGIENVPVTNNAVVNVGGLNISGRGRRSLRLDLIMLLKTSVSDPNSSSSMVHTTTTIDVIIIIVVVSIFAVITRAAITNNNIIGIIVIIIITNIIIMCRLI